MYGLLPFQPDPLQSMSNLGSFFSEQNIRIPRCIDPCPNCTKTPCPLAITDELSEDLIIHLARKLCVFVEGRCKICKHTTQVIEDFNKHVTKVARPLITINISAIDQKITLEQHEEDDISVELTWETYSNWVNNKHLKAFIEDVTKCPEIVEDNMEDTTEISDYWLLPWHLDNCEVCAGEESCPLKMIDKTTTEERIGEIVYMLDVLEEMGTVPKELEAIDRLRRYQKRIKEMYPTIKIELCWPYNFIKIMTGENSIAIDVANNWVNWGRNKHLLAFIQLIKASK